MTLAKVFACLRPAPHAPESCHFPAKSSQNRTQTVQKPYISVQIPYTRTPAPYRPRAAYLGDQTRADRLRPGVRALVFFQRGKERGSGQSTRRGHGLEFLSGTSG